MTQGDAVAAPIEPSLDTAWWQDALARGELMIPHCETCDRRFFPPQAFCPHCGSDRLGAIHSDGAGSIYSWVVIHRPFGPYSGEVPYAIVAVDMADGARLIGRYVGDLDAIEAGRAVFARIISLHGVKVLGFAVA